ncbi:MAG TPA: polysaccharide biosynthesis tyrosine autokinase [Phenylobacterium sp.]
MTVTQSDFLQIPGPGYGSMESAGADPFSFAMLWRVLRRRYRLFFGTTLLVAVIFAGLAFVLPARYSAEARLMVDPRPRSSPVTTAGRSLANPDAGLVDTEVQIITSPPVMKAVVERLGLTRDPEFAASPAKPPNSAAATQAAAEKLVRRVKAERQGLTYIVTIRASSRDPAKAARLADATSAEYLRHSKSQRAQLAAEQARTLTAELGPLGREVVQADEAVAQYRAQNGIISSGAANTGTINDQQIGAMAAELGRASADAAAGRSVAAAARTQSRSAGVESISQVSNSESLAELRRQRAQVLREQSQIATIYGPTSPAARRIDEQLARLNREINTAATRIVRGLESDAAAAAARESTLRAKLGQLQQRQTVDAQATAVAEGLQRTADAKRGIYNELSRNAQEQAQEARIGDVKAWTVSTAETPSEPSFPKPAIFGILGLLFGSAIGAGAVVAAELREGGFRSGAEVQSALRLPFIAAMPELKGSGPRRLLGRKSAESEEPTLAWDYVVDRPASQYAESVRNIRAALCDEPGRPNPRSICITSAVVGEGKSALAVSLARIMALSGDRVLLIDCDLRKTGLARLPQPGPRPGLMDVLDGAADPQTALENDVVPGLTVLGEGSPIFTPRDMFSGQAARDLLRRLEQEYDYVILDAPPVLALTDAWTIASLSEATVLVVQHSKTPRDAVIAAVERLRQRGARLLGVVLSRSKAQGPGDAGYYDSMHDDYYLN